ncbi:hypothetical protein [Novosphingobium olei]|uniref:Uncharacterized protein n=1 Tax=Novosphingobium olei TaxID=2728851 RepID=A0A7Y0BNX6_9SPHN|nr:hypothetical protein [Novosphingobium olei]NML93829.1 hypothetical protein [Novosphingobium olei]
MEIEKLVQPAPDWCGGSWAARIDQAASVLFLHGYISQSQRQKITQKLEKQFQAGLGQGRIVCVATKENTYVE